MTSPILRRNVGDDEHQDFTLEGITCTVGRSRECDVTINDTSLSRLHMRLENREGTYFLVDNNSSNGTFLNRRKIAEAPLIHGDVIIAGRVQFDFLQEENPEGSVTRPMPAFGEAGVSRTVTVNFDDMPSEGGDLLSLDPKEEHPPPPPPEESSSSPHRTAPLTPCRGKVGDPWRRLAAVFIDAGVNIALFIPSIVTAIFRMSTLSTLFALLATLLCMGHLVIGWMKYRKTLGKHLMGLQIELVDDPNALELPPKVVLLRLVCFFLAFTILFDAERRGIHDKIAGTRVIHLTEN